VGKEFYFTDLNSVGHMGGLLKG